MKKTAKIKFSSDRKCFISLPRSWTVSLPRDKISVFHIEGGEQNVDVYCSWSGDSHSEEETVQINGLFANKQHLNQGEEVLVTMVTDVPACNRVFVEPVSVDDWEILELHASYVESNLLHQLRVVSSQQVVPVWLQKSICVFVKIGDTDPPKKCCLLEEKTEVIIAPKTRPANWKPATKQRTVKPEVAAETETEETSHTVEEPAEKHEEDDLVAENTETQTGIVSKTLGYLKSWFGGVNDSATEEKVDQVEVSYLDVSLDCSLRVQALEKMKRDDDVLVCCENQPTNVYISRETFSEVFRLDDCPVSFLACISRQPSPKEKEEMMKKQLEKQNKEKLRNMAQKDSVSELVESEEEDSVSGRKFPVRVIIIDGKFHSVDKETNMEHSEKDEFNVRFKEEWGVLKNHVMIHDLLRKQLGLEVTGKVKLEVMPRSCQHLEIREITAHPLFEMPDGFTKDMLQLSVESRVKCYTSATLPLVVGQGTMISAMLKPEQSEDFLLTFPQSPSPPADDTFPPFVLLAPCDRLNVKIAEQLTPENRPPCVARLPFFSVSQMDPKVPEVAMETLGGIVDVITPCISHVIASLAASPLSDHLQRAAGVPSPRGLMITGPRGSGKTALGKAIGREVAKSPHSAYVTAIDCKGYRGKQISHIRKHLERVLAECTWRQPSVLVLDDLDLIAATPSGPEQEQSGEALYFARVANVLKDFLKQYARCSTRLVVIATCRSRNAVHETLSASHGNHFFSKYVEIKPPDRVQREAILKSIISSKISLDCAEDLDLASIAKVTEGHVARDLCMVVDRALHVHSMMKQARKKGSGGDPCPLSVDDLRVALDGFTAASLRGVSLHKAGEDVSWGDVGGLGSVRDTLVETLEWPAKYPLLFSSCPLRLRSGILLYGAPGTGKTLLAGVLAKECGLNFISIKGPELLSKYIGASEQSVRDTFERASSAKPCVLFFDEFDSLAPRRGHDSTGVTDRVVNQLLTQLDGVEGLEGVYVVAATSRPDLIDPALLRPGRLDKALLCDMPADSDRTHILKALTRKMKLAEDVDLEDLASRCEHFTGADFKALLYNAQLEAVHEVTGSLIEGSPKSVKSVTSNGSWEKLAITDKESWNSLPESDKSAGDEAVVIEKTPVKERTARSREPRLAYIPSLGEGTVELSLEEEEKLREKVEQVLGITQDATVTGSDESSVAMVITRQHIETALSTMAPSVSEAERRKYRIIYENFVSSRGGTFGSLSGGKRATLA